MDTETEGMEVEGQSPTLDSVSLETSVVMTIGTYDCAINTVASVTHATTPLTLLAFGGLSTEIQILARCMHLVTFNLTLY